MQYVAGDFNPTGGAADARQLMGTATGAAAMTQMMGDRQGLMLQMRVEADIDTLYSVLEFLQDDHRNAELFKRSYDDGTIQAFFECDFRSELYIEPVKGSDEPQYDAVNAYKAQSFAQLTANLTGLHQFDPTTFYDIISEVGRTMNIPISVGAGRKERNLANNRINRVVELYDDMKGTIEMQQLPPEQQGVALFQAVLMKDRQLITTLGQGMATPQAPVLNPIQAITAMLQTASPAEIYLYDWSAFRETYSDWLAGDEGQNCDIPVQVGVGLLYIYALQLEEQRRLMDIQKAAALSPMPPPGQGQGVKSDGTTGPGRPKEPKADESLKG